MDSKKCLFMGLMRLVVVLAWKPSVPVRQYSSPADARKAEVTYEARAGPLHLNSRCQSTSSTVKQPYPHPGSVELQ